MARGITIDLIVDPKGAISGIGQVEDKASRMSGVLAGLGGAAVAGVAALGLAAAGAAAGLASATKSAGEYAENVQLAASKTHLSTAAVQELQYASKVTGVEFETISGSMTKLTKSMGAAAAGNDATSAAFARLGVATTDANGNLLDSTVVYSNVIAALGQVSNPAERDVLALQLMGKSATELNPLIDGTAGSLADLAAQAHGAGAVLSGDMLAKLGSVDDALDTLGAGVDAAKNALGLVLMPVLQELGTEGTGLLGDFTRAVLDADGDLSKAAPAIGAVFGDAATFLLGQVPKFLEVGASIITSIITGIAVQGPALITSAVPVLVGFVTTILGQLPMILDAGMKMLIALVQGVAQALPTLIPAAVQAVVGLVGALVANLPLLLDAGLQLLTGLTTGIIAALPGLIEQLPAIILGIVDFLIGAIPTLIDAGLQLFLSIVDALPDIITGIVAAIPQIIIGIQSALISAMPTLIDAGIKLFLALITAMPTIIDTLVRSIPQIVTGLVGAIANSAPQMVTAGEDLLRGLWDGIAGMGDWLWNQMSSFFGGIIDNVKGLLGIHSPSTVFADMGKNLGLGMVQGIEKSTADVQKAMDALVAVPSVGSMRLSVDAVPGVQYAAARRIIAEDGAAGGALSGSGVDVQTLTGALTTALRAVFDDLDPTDLSTDTIDRLSRAIAALLRVQSRKGVSVLG